MPIPQALGRLRQGACEPDGYSQGAEWLGFLLFVPPACGGRLGGLDFPRWQLTNCPPGHLDLSLTFLVLHMVSSVPKPGLRTWTHRALQLPAGLVPWDSNKGNLSCPSWAPALPLPEGVAIHAGQSQFRALLGQPASGSEQGDMNLSRNERPVGSAEGTWQTRLSPPSPPLSGSPSCFLLFQSTLKPSQHTCLLSAWHALSSRYV